MNRISSVLILGISTAWFLVVAALVVLMGFAAGALAWGVPTAFGAELVAGGSVAVAGVIAWRMQWLDRTLEAAELRPAEEARPGRALASAAGRLTGGLAVALVATGLLWSARMTLLARRLKAEGLPVSCADLARAVPAGRNAAPAIEAWLIPLTRSLTGDGHLAGDYGRATMAVDGLFLREPGPGGADLRHRWPTDARALIDRVRRAHGRYQTNVETGLARILATRTAYEGMDGAAAAAHPFDSALPPYGALVLAARAFTITAVDRALRGDASGAWAGVRHQLELARLALQDPPLIAKMVGIADVDIAWGTTIGLLQNRPESAMPPDLVRLMRAMAAGPAWVPAGVQGEIAARFDQRAAFRRMWRRGPLEGFRRFAFARQKLLDLTGAVDALTYASFEHVLLPLARSTGWSSARAVTDVSDWAEARGWVGAWAGAGFPKYSALLAKDAEARAGLRLALACSALHAYRSRTGHVPAALADLVPRDTDATSLTDPFTGQPLEYAATEDRRGYTLFSAGPFGTHESTNDQLLGIWEPLPSAPVRHAPGPRTHPVVPGRPRR